MCIGKKVKTLIIAAATMAAMPAAAATVPLPPQVSPYGGLFIDARGSNGQRLLSFTAASELNKGTSRGDPETNDFFIGEQGGFTAGILDQLGGGFLSFTVRLTVFDADNDPGNFDHDDNLLRINDIIIGNFSDVVTTTTDADGNVLNGLNDGIGFGDEETDTGTFTLTDESALAALFASLESENSLSFEIDKLDDNGNFFDFTSESRIPSTGTTLAPTISAVPLPAGLWLLLAGLGGFGMFKRRAAV